uniref:Centrosomin N-terminal motif 1 domain-containing protein n=1 Tax=Oncorhynchus mykiss TaxID=8022 RepID=A0A8K9VDZ9_ONCMY
TVTFNCFLFLDVSCDETEQGPSPPLQTHSLREFEQHLNDLKKENFSLKLRIYFLEERIQQKYEDSSHDVHKRVSLTGALRGGGQGVGVAMMSTRG